MKRYIGIKVIAVFTITLAVVSIVYVHTSESLNELILTVRESSQPDSVLIKVKQIDADIVAAESGVRAFMLTQDEKYLEPYQNLVNTIDVKIDALKVMTNRRSFEVATIDSVSTLLKQKLNLYDDLLNISYNKILDSAFGKLSTSIIENDSARIDTMKITEEKKGWLKRIFTSSKNKELKQQADSAKKESERNRLKITAYKKSISDIEESQSQFLKKQTKRELLLLKKDKAFSLKIRQLIRNIEADELLTRQQKAARANDSAKRSGRFILQLIIVGAIVVILLTGLILYDNTKSNSYRKQLAEAKLNAERNAKIKEEFLANMSHEIRTPLSAILGYASRLQKTNLDNKQEHFAQAINTSSEHLLSIVNDILDLTKIETGNLNFEKTNFSPSEIVEEVCEALKLNADEKNLKLIFNIEKIKGVNVLGDPLRLKQILFNIIGNAIKFTEKGFVKIDVESFSGKDVSTSTQSFKFIIYDTGIGIPDEKMATIFEQFTQADASMSRKFGGSGLGLSITKKLVELQQGTIDVENILPHGAIFTFAIPYQVFESGIAGKTNDGTQLKASDKNVNSLKGIKILLAEDDELNRILQVEMLEDFGAEVIAVTNGLEVLQLLSTANYQVVLMDIHMPVMNGMETINEIREKLKSHIPVIAMTANIMQHDIQIYMEAGFDAYITKPFKENDVANKILQAISGNVEVEKTETINEVQIVSDTLYVLDDLRKASKGNNEFIVKMLKIFLTSTEGILTKAKQNAEENNWSEVRENVHRLIPSCKHLSVYTMSDKLKIIEDMCLSDPDKNKVLNLLADINDQFIKVSFALNKEISLIEVAKNIS